MLCRRAAYLATCLGFLGGYWFSGWSLRAKNKKMKQKYEKEIAVRKRCYWRCLCGRVVWVFWLSSVVEWG